MEFKDLNLLSVGNTIKLIGAVYQGDGHTILCPFPGHEGQVQGEGESIHYVELDGLKTQASALSMSPDEWQQFLRQTDIMETEVLVEAEENGVRKLVKAVLRKSSRQISQQVSWAVFRRDSYACRYCGNDKTPLTVDHLVLWEKGGPSTEANLLSACKKCNKTRGNIEYAEWLNHRFYKRVSRNLTKAQREANVAVAKTLDTIPRMVHKQTKR